MRPLVPLLATAALVAAATVSTDTPAVAAGESCQGRPATIVGSPQTLQVMGTEGPDVVVSAGANQVHALGGDDLICVTGYGASVFAGDGDDVVDASALTGSSGTQARLGAGSDTFVGSPGFDVVWAGTPVEGTFDQTDTEADVVDTGAAPSAAAKDIVYSGQAGVPNSDLIRMERGSLVWAGIPTAQAAIDGGAGSMIGLHVAGAGEVAIDNVHGTLAVDAHPVLHFSGLTSFSLNAEGTPARLSFRGGSRSEELRLERWATGRHSVLMGAGADRVLIHSTGTVALPPGSSYVGGNGRDRLDLTLPDEVDVDLDLAKGRLTTGRKKAETTVRARSFEDAAVMADDVEIVGTGKRNDVQVYACRSRVEGRGGADRLSTFDQVMDEGLDCRRPRARFHGGRGNDRLSGSAGPDRLIGGPGRDTIDGRAGRDTCQGEKVRRCEIRLR